MKYVQIYTSVYFVLKLNSVNLSIFYQSHLDYYAFKTYCYVGYIKIVQYE